MAGELPKLNAAPLLAFPLAFAHVAYQLAKQALGKHDAAAKISALKEHSVVQQVSSKKELLLALLGLVLVFHGAHFKNLLLCSQVVLAFLYDRVTGSVAAIYSDIQSAQEKLKADAPDTSNEKKQAGKADPSEVEAKRKEDAEMAKKALKALNPEKLSAAILDVLGSLMACALIIHGGFAQKVAIACPLVNLIVDKVDALIDFPDHQDIKGWTTIFLRIALYAVILPLTAVASSLALAMNAAACGAVLATEHGVRFLAGIGKVPDADAFFASKNNFFAIGGFIAFGTIWQVWALAADSGLGYFAFLYFPAVLAEAVIGFVAGGSA